MGSHIDVVPNRVRDASTAGGGAESGVIDQALGATAEAAWSTIRHQADDTMAAAHTAQLACATQTIDERAARLRRGTSAYIVDNAAFVAHEHSLLVRLPQ